MRARLKRVLVFAGGALAAFVVGLVVLNVAVGLLIGHGSEVEVPDLSGLTVEDARARLAAKELALAVKSERPSALFPAKRIVSQLPKPLARVKPGRRVEVIVSTGVEMIRVPDVRRLSLAEARTRLTDAGLVPGAAIDVPSREDEGTVLASSPPESAAVARGAEVALLVSHGADPEVYVMPDLVGVPYEDVARALRVAGFAVGAITTRPASPRDRGRVVEQHPGPGTRIPAGATIDLVVGADE
jgi:serine/threonine-protein kinase